jgi:hypothetical protein
MITYALILTFSTMSNTEEYVIDYNLTKSDCIERMQEEIDSSKHETVAQVYKDYVEAYKAQAMAEKPVSYKFSCVKG